MAQFFGSYFHQDWDLNDATAGAVTQRFVVENSAEVVRKVSLELGQLLSLPATESDLRQLLFDELGCYYLPPEGVSTRKWLLEAQDTLAEAGY